MNLLTLTKLLLFSSLIAAFMTPTAYGCNGGCPSGGGYLGIVPQFTKNFIGIRYRLRSFEFLDRSSPLSSTSKHQFQTAELWGRFYPSKRLQAFVFLPFQINNEKREGATQNLSGAGDLSFILNYTLINNGDSLDVDWKHTLLLGAGAKIPTGRYQQRNVAKQMYPITFQPGTGAYSGIFSGMYTIRYKKMGLNTNVSYYYNGKNELDYSFGNLSAGSASLFYWLKAGSVSLLPNLGTYMEHAARDIDNDYYVNNTGGTIAYSSLGVDAYVGRLAIGASIQTPYYQHLPLREQHNDLRLMTSAVWLF